MNNGAFGENFPYTNFHDLNLDWIIRTIKSFDTKLDSIIAGQIKVADPMQWNIATQYEQFTVVTDDGKAYISLQPVPSGIPLSDTEYWSQIFDIDALFDSFKDAITSNDDGLSVTSSEPRTVNSLVWLNDILHKVTAPIAQYETYSSSNVSPISIEEWVQTFMSALTTRLDSTDAEVEKLVNRTTLPRNFILIGDSFGGGIDGDDNAHAVQGGGWIQRFADAVAGWATVYNSQQPLGGVYGFASSRPFLDVLQDAETHITDKSTITDIVVLGGTNDIGIAEASIKSAIEQFVTYCHTNYPQARVAIGCIGSYVNQMINTMGPIYAHCKTKGAEYISDLRGLMCLKQYIGADNLHLNASGYAFYQPFITQAILTGYSEWGFNEQDESLVVGINTNFSVNHGAIRLSYKITNHNVRIGLCGTSSDHLGIANLMPVKPSDTSTIQVCILPAIRVLLPYLKIQQVRGASGEVCELFTTPNDTIEIRRPYGMSNVSNLVCQTDIVNNEY